MPTFGRLFVFGIIAAVFGLLSGCATLTDSNDILYNVYEIGSFEPGDGGEHISEVSFWGAEKISYHNDADAPKEASVAFDGKTYTGQYSRSSVIIPNTYVSHRYKGEHDGQIVYFETHAETGAITSILLVSKTLEQSVADQAACRQVADKIAKEYIPVEEYAVSVTASTKDENSVAYTYAYYREVNGYRTSDGLQITVDGNGNITSFGVGMLGAFADGGSIVIDEERARSAISQKLDAIYERFESGTKSFEIRDKQLVKTDTGKEAVLYTIDVSLTIPDEADTYLTTRNLVQLLLTVA